MLLGLYAARGQQGALDPSFSGDGWAKVYYLTEENTYDDRVEHMLLLPGGKYIAVIGGGTEVLARYNADGTLDQSYGSGGYAYVNFAVYSAALAPEDKVVLGGYWYNYAVDQWQFAVARYNSDGSIDDGFGTNGVAFADFAPYGQDYTASASALVVQSDGKIVAVGTGYYYDNYNNIPHYAWLTARFTTTGTLDASFGTGGKQTVELGGYTEVNAVALQGDKIVLGGRSQDPVTYQQNFSLVRLLNNGGLDGSFGTGGIAAPSLGTDTYLETLAIQPDGKIVVAGAAYVDDGTGSYTLDLALARYLNDGSNDGTPDASFGTGGLVTTNLGAEENLYALALGSGSIVVAGNRGADDGTGNWTSDIVVARYRNDGTADGTLDASFNAGGSPAGTLVSGLAGDDYANAVVVLSGGSIVVAGEVYNSTAQNQDYLLARYTAGGVLDATFNPTGTPAGLLLAYYAPGTWSEINALAVQPDGKVVAAGVGWKYDLGSGFYFPVMAVARFMTDGTLDGSFGTKGVAYAEFVQNNPNMSLYVTTVALAPEGKIVVGGYTDYYDDVSGHSLQDFTLARFTSAGTLDTDFGGGDGMVTSDWNPNDQLRALAVQSDGKIVAVGQSFNELTGFNTLDFFVARYTADGVLDNTFDTDGTVSTDFFGYEDYAVDVAIQSDGKIVVSGGVENYDAGSGGYYYNFAVARYTSTGVLDSRFGTGGKATASTIEAHGGGFLAVQSDGKILVGGVSVNQENAYFDPAVVRLTSRGTLDGTFGTGGVATVSLGVEETYSGGIALQSDGSILQATRYQLYDAGSTEWIPYLSLVRYTSAGVLDNSFDTDGKVVHQMSNKQYYDYNLNDIAWHNGRLYTGGEIFLNIGADAGYLAAYTAGEAVQPLPLVIIEDAEVTEGGTASVTVRVNTTSHPDLTLSYATLDGSATSKGKTPDYKATRGSVTIANGSDVGTISITTYSDAAVEPVDETFTVNLSVKGRTADLFTISDGSATVSIKDQTGEVNKAVTVGELPEGGLAVKAFPNPTRGYFTLQLQSGHSAPVTLRVTDMLGRLVEAKAGVAANGTLQLGSNYRPGVYYIHLQQGTEKQTLKLVKEAQ